MCWAALIGLTLSIFVFTTLTFLEYVKTVFDKNATLSITDQCITDQLSIFSVGNISWSDISEIKITPALKTEFLVIAVTDPQLFIARKKQAEAQALKVFFKKIWLAHRHLSKEDRLQPARFKGYLANGETSLMQLPIFCTVGKNYRRR